MAEAKTYAYNKDGELVPVKHCDIAVCEAANRKTILHTTDKKRFTCNKTLKKVEEELCPDTFKRIHDHLTINTDEVKKVLPYKVRHYKMSNGMTVISSKRMNKNYNPK